MKRLLIVIAVIIGVSLVGTVAGGGSLLPGGGGGGDRQPAASDQGDAGADTAAEAPEEPEEAEEPATVDVTRVRPAGEAFVLLSPGTGAPGSEVNVTGAGFDAGATVDFKLKADEVGEKELGFAEVGESGSFTTSFAIPEDLKSGEFTFTARQDGGAKQAEATGTVQAGAPEVKLGTLVGQPGEDVTLSGSGFAKNETVKVYLNRIGGEPLAEFRASEDGDIGRNDIALPFAPPGNANLIFVGEESQAPATVQVLMLNLFPTTSISSYASKPGKPVSFSGEGFGPNETVAVYLNAVSGPPITTFETSEDGTFHEKGTVEIPYELKGSQNFILVGNKSQAASTVGFNVLPFTPSAEPSAYGARPGTTISFYGKEFAPNEVVRVVVKRSEGDAGKEVSCFRVDDRGEFRGAGSYRIPADVSGELTVLLTGDTSDATARLTLEVAGAGGDLTEQADEPEYACPFDKKGGGQDGRQQSEGSERSGDRAPGGAEEDSGR